MKNEFIWMFTFPEERKQAKRSAKCLCVLILLRNRARTLFAVIFPPFLTFGLQIPNSHDIDKCQTFEWESRDHKHGDALKVIEQLDS
jgi:hypothetical protein